jgi:hypothetical protein
MSPLLLALIITANPISVLPCPHHHHLRLYHLSSHCSRYRDHPSRLGHHLPNHQQHLRSTSLLSHGNWKCSSFHHYERNEDTKVSIQHHRPSTGHWQRSHEGRCWLRCSCRCRSCRSPLVTTSLLRLSITTYEPHDLMDGWL